MIADILHKLASQFQQEEHDYYPRPSLSGPERCIRSLVYWGMQTPRDPLPGRTLFVFDDGKWHEELTMNWLRQSAFQIHSEQMKVKTIPPLNGFIILEGSIDGIVTDLMGKDYLIEHKAINHFNFEKYWNKEEYPLDNMTQTCLYLRGLNVINLELKEAILLIKNKNTSAYLEYLLEYDYCADAVFIVNKINSNGEKVDIKESIEHITADAFEKFATVQAHIDKKTLPDRQYDQDHWRCSSYCGWSKTCWENYAEEFQELKTDHVLTEEFATEIRFFQELGGQINDIKNQREEIKKHILDDMSAAKAREGRCGEYIIKLILQHKKEFIVPASSFEKLIIKKIKEG